MLSYPLRSQDVRFESLADIDAYRLDVRFTPEIGQHVGNVCILPICDIVARCLHSKEGCFLFLYALPSSANSSNSRLATHSALNDPICVAFSPCVVFTFTIPSSIAYDPLSGWPLNSAVICCQTVRFATARRSHTRGRSSNVRFIQQQTTVVKKP